MSSNPYAQDATVDIKGFFQVSDEDNCRRLIDAKLVTTIVENTRPEDDDDDSEVTIFLDTNDEEPYVTTSEKYLDVLNKFAKAREA